MPAEPLICEDCEQEIILTVDDRKYGYRPLRCEACRCKVCEDEPYSYVHGDEEIGCPCPECGRGEPDEPDFE